SPQLLYSGTTPQGATRAAGAGTRMRSAAALDKSPGSTENSKRLQTREGWMPRIEQIFFLPPMAVARIGGSSQPLDSFEWIEDPTLHGAGRTVINPAVTLEVQQDGSVRPFVPGTIQFRDGNLLRPTAPFLELWAKVEGAPDLQD